MIGMRRSGSIVLFAGLLLAIAAQLDAQNPATQSARRRGGDGVPPAPDQAAVDRGQKLFVESCGFCHGKEANGGDGGPDLIRSVLANHDENGNLIGPVILNGRTDKGMPKFNMSQAQISDIVAFLRFRNRYVRYRQLYQVKSDVVTGDAKAGEVYFNGAGRCNRCHSPAGDLGHIAARLEPEFLMRRFLYPASREFRARGETAANERARVMVTVTLPSGETASGPLEHLDEFSVSMRDVNADYHTWWREDVKVEVHDPLAAHADLLKQYTDTDIHNLLAYLETLK
jgi:cytochrome c oxidase cbb3-type subunit 3